MGVVAFIILVSKGFSKPGFATQIGSLVYLVPLFLSLYLRALEMKHRMAENANKGYKSGGGILGGLASKGHETNDGWSGARKYFKDHPQNVTQNPDDFSNPLDNDFKIIDDDVPAPWEAIAHKVIQLMPHSSFTDVAVQSFTSKSIADVYFLQIMSFLILLSSIVCLENF